jgi:hypothetical protein
MLLGVDCDDRDGGALRPVWDGVEIAIGPRPPSFLRRALGIRRAYQGGRVEDEDIVVGSFTRVVCALWNSRRS